MKADPDKCIACKRCFPYCPMGRIQTFHRHDMIPGRVYIEIDQEACTDCGMCLRAAICPVNALYQPQESWPREVRGILSNPMIEFKGSQVPGRGTEEMKTNDVKGTFMPDISEKGELMAGRIAMAGAIVVAGYLGMNPPGFAAQVVALAFGLAASSIFPALMMGIFSKRINNTGAICGMLSGLLFTLVYIFIYKGWFFVVGTNWLPNTPDNWLLGIAPESIGAIGALVNFVVATAVSRVTAEPPEHIQDLVESIRVPRGAGAAHAH